MIFSRGQKRSFPKAYSDIICLTWPSAEESKRRECNKESAPKEKVGGKVGEKSERKKWKRRAFICGGFRSFEGRTKRTMDPGLSFAVNAVDRLIFRFRESAT
ncbi:Hypothetical protein NTJ_06640 [Nesidiocoris tenuis]|uniref:Uncharacterized protein n=1 Tax=Nesidiocoris tenuis TaxID=355587 RepID=A0ABN7ANM6_9HEMI|nr:Hypothetical protein NTJ_06640 [Nesidiocoris tenuis]